MEFHDIPRQNSQDKEGTLSPQSILSLILDQLPEGLLVLDSENRARLANRAAHRILDIPLPGTEETLAPQLTQHLHWIEALNQPVERLPFAFEANLSKDRHYRIEVSYLPGLGKVVRIEDISPFRKLEKVKDEFVQTVSHDLRSPLTAVLGYVGLIERVGPVTEQQREFIQQARGGVETIRHMLDKLLELQRIEAGLDSQIENVSAQVILEQTADAFDFQIGRRGQTLTLNLPEEPVTLRGNPIRLRQIFDNLVDNASKYTPQGGQIQITSDVEEGIFIVQISDSGFGILEEEIPHIFDQFYRGSTALDQATGAGLGLSIVHSLVDDFQGRIWVESSPGNGSTFTVVLPTA